MLEALPWSKLDLLSLDAIIEAKTKILWFQRSISNSASWTSSDEGLLLYLSFIPEKPPRDFQALEISATELRHWRSVSRDEPSSESSSETVSYWMTILNGAFNDREPEEFHLERIFADLRSQAIPDYAEASVKWPQYAGRYWSVLRPQIFSLFNASRSFNFVQWVLEFARKTWPETYGKYAAAEPMMDLTDALCSGTITPLHGPMGTPLLCSLLGHNSFLEALYLTPWLAPTNPITYANQDRVETILLLIDAGADCTCDFKWGDKNGSILPLAFWASLVMNNESILHRVREKGASVDFAMEEVLRYPETEIEGSRNKKTMSKLLTYIFDLFMKQLVDDFNFDEGVNSVIKSLMTRMDIDFASEGGQRKLEGVPDEVIFTLSESAILEGMSVELRRLVLDPRFDPNPESVDEEDCDTLLHTAVSSNSLLIVDILVSAGAKLNAVGQYGRTPIMVVESVQMLEKLVEHGATTTDVDYDGRNIWHYAAANNDMDMLEWLCDNDPWKAENLKAVTDGGCTPLAEAFFSIESLAAQPSSMGPTQNPEAATRLLQEYDGNTFLMSPTPLTHLAAAWGDLGLIEGLAKLGANFRQPDEDGQTALHYLNFSASTQVVKRLQELCYGAPVESDQNFTPAETIFTNFWPFFDESDPANPLPTHAGRAKRLSVLHDSIATALRCIVRAGGLHNYEERKGWSAVMCFRGGELEEVTRVIKFYERRPRKSWNVKYFHRSIIATLENSGPIAAENFYRSAYAVHLLAEAALHRKMALVKHLCARGVRVFECHNGKCGPVELDFLYPLEWIITRSRDTEPLGELLKHVTAKELNDGQDRLVDALCSWKGTGKPAKIEMLLRKGLDLNYLPKGDDADSMLGRVILNGVSDVAVELLKNGANPRLGFGSSNAALCAAYMGDRRVLLEIMRRFGNDFPWKEVGRTHGDLDGNVLHIACFQGHDETLTTLLELEGMTGLVSHVNGLADGKTPAHIAALMGSARCIKVLNKWGAKFDIREETQNGGTPLHVVCSIVPTKGYCDTLLALTEFCPAAVKIKDTKGRTPLTIAIEGGHTAYLETLWRVDASIDELADK
ncbi:Ankyrin repeat [Geosmithia morbida]|uniref:Ankyrin repeat n=1 Tax=Geosmithia morbida TaxID=1094350 RepID=A0A9P5D1N0_9HYPO|nr:Ankyrin repeat [Geosmithia morbida]KAF4122927.1 Ankyrin repeat [Geosmithia morbida]